jgi:ribosomal protein S18 acetylase RimI-like enzyme
VRIIDSAQPGDIPALVDLVAATFPLACPPGTDPADIADHISKQLNQEQISLWQSQPSFDLLVARGDDRLAGYILLDHQPLEETPAVAHWLTIAPRSELSKCYVDPAFHGQSVAQALMSAAGAVARHRGSLALWLGVNQLNARAIRFYRRCGFSIVGPRVFTVGCQSHHDFIMEWSLV